MTNSTETYWSIDGVSLQTYAFNIETWGGDSQAPPPVRGQNTVVPYAVGETWHRKVPDARTVSFGMWVLGAEKDGSIPTGVERRRKFEENWRMLRKLMWNPNRQIELTKRFKDWASGEIVEATALAEFAGGLEPTMTGTQRALFTVQFRLADPFFYGEKQRITTNAMAEAARNYAKNPSPRKSATWYDAPLTTSTTPVVVEVDRYGTTDTAHAEIIYHNRPSDGIGGIAYGGNGEPGIEVTPGMTMKFSATLGTKLKKTFNTYTVFYQEDGTFISRHLMDSNLTVEANAWVVIGNTNITVPTGAARAQIEAVSTTAVKTSTSNRFINPGFKTVAGLPTTLHVNEYTNPGFEDKGIYSEPNIPLVRNFFANSALEKIDTTAKTVELVNYVKNPKLADGLKGWFPRPKTTGNTATQALKLVASGPVGGASMRFVSTQAGGILSSRYIPGDAVVNKNSGTVHGLERPPKGTYYGTVWAKTLSGTTDTVEFRLTERKTDGTSVGYKGKKHVLTDTWKRIDVEYDKQAAGTDLHVYFITGKAITIYLSGVMVSNSDAFAGYYDGDGLLKVPSGRTDASNYPQPWKVSWAGKRNASRSIMKLEMPAGVKVGGNRLAYITNDPVTTEKSLVIVRSDRRDPDLEWVNAGVWVYTTTAADVGKTITVVAEAVIPSGYSAAEDTALTDSRPSRAIYVLDDEDNSIGRVQAPSTVGTHVVRAAITPTAAGQLIRLSGGGTATTPMMWRKITLVRGEYKNGPAFTGSRKSKADTVSPWDSATPKWTGASLNSASELRVFEPTGVSKMGGDTRVLMNTTINMYEGKMALEINRWDSTAEEAAQGVALQQVVPAGDYTIIAAGTIPAGYDASEDLDIPGARSRSIFTTRASVPQYATLPTTPGRHIIRLKVSNDTPFFIQLGGGGKEFQSVYWDAITYIEGHHDNVLPFSGRTISTDPYVKYSWEGTPDASRSRMSVVAPAGLVSPVNSVLKSIELVDATHKRSSAKIRPYAQDPEVNYVVFSNLPELLAWDSEDYQNFTVMMEVTAKGLDANDNDSARRLQLLDSEGTVIAQSEQFSLTADRQLMRWTFARPEEMPGELRVNVGHSVGEVFLEQLAVVPTTYTGAFFDGDVTGSTWVGTPNASMTRQNGDAFRLRRVFARKSTYTGAWFDGDTATTGSGDLTKDYSWTGVPQMSESIVSGVSPKGVTVEVAGDYTTRRIRVIARAPIGSYSIKNESPDVVARGYKYPRGTTDVTVVNVDKFAVSEAGKTNFAYAVEPYQDGYWLELAAGRNNLLLTGVGAGKLELEYQAAWI